MGKKKRKMAEVVRVLCSTYVPVERKTKLLCGLSTVRTVCIRIYPHIHLHTI